jgi:HD-like signal output (HDOD) protein
MLAKPFELDEIIEVIDRAACLREFEVPDDVRRALGSITTLPVIPSCYLELVEYFKSESEPEIQVVAELISKDISILSKIIQIANSSFFGSVIAVFTAKDAIVRLGFDLVIKLVFCFEIHASIRDEEQHKQLLSEAKQVANRCVYLSDVAQLSRADKERSYFTGLVHNIGELVLEQYELNLPSSVIGAFFMQLWGFEQDLVDALRYQDSPEGLTAEDPVALHLYVAKQLVSAEQNGLSQEDIWNSFASELLGKANLRECLGESNE